MIGAKISLSLSLYMTRIDECVFPCLFKIPRKTEYNTNKYYIREANICAILCDRHELFFKLNEEIKRILLYVTDETVIIYQIMTECRLYFINSISIPFYFLLYFLLSLLSFSALFFS